jgi:hypothetical protein
MQRRDNIQTSTPPSKTKNTSEKIEGSIIKVVEEFLDGTGRKEEKFFDNDAQFFDWVLNKWFIEMVVVPIHN